MVDTLLRQVFDPALRPLASKLGWSGAVVAGFGFALALAGLPLTAKGYFLAGVVILAASRAVFALASACAGDKTADAALSDILGTVSLAGYPFAFALAAPEHAPACAFLMFGMTAMFAAGFAFPKAGGFALGGIDIAVLLGLCALVHDWFGPIAYAGGVVCFMAAGLRIDAGRRTS